MSFAESLFDLIEKVVNFLFVISPFSPASAESRVLNPADHRFVIRRRAFIPWSHMSIIADSCPGRNRTPGRTNGMGEDLGRAATLR